jgi:hypothetical protein
MLKNLSLIILFTLTFTACSGSYVGVPGSSESKSASVEGAGNVVQSQATVALYQMVVIYSSSDSSGNITYSDTRPLCGKTVLALSQLCSISALEAFQLITDQNLIQNINGQLAGTVPECPSNVAILPAVVAPASATPAAPSPGSAVVTPTTPIYYFLNLGASSAVGILTDSNYKVTCKMSFTNSVSDSTATPIIQKLTPESIYDPTKYTYSIQEIPAAQLAPQTFKILGLLKSLGGFDTGVNFDTGVAVPASTEVEESAK